MYYLCLCFIWKRLWELTQRQHEKRREKKKQIEDEKRRKKSKQRQTSIKADADHTDGEEEYNDFDLAEDVDEEDFNEKQEFKRTTFPFPSMPFSTSNRTQSASVNYFYF